MSSNYSCEIDRATRSQWDGLLALFDDATVYQSWSYGAMRWGEEKLSHAVVSRNGEPMAIAQLRILTVPLVRKGIAYLNWGPLCKRKGGPADSETLRVMAEGLREEYVRRRGLLLRVFPNAIDGDDEEVRRIFDSTGYTWSQSPYRTIIMDLSRSLEELRMALDKKWRSQLNKAERGGLELVRGVEKPLFEELTIPFRTMMERKNIGDEVGIDKLGLIQEDLPPERKMKIVVARKDGQPVGSLLASCIGNKGIFISGGNTRDGLESGAARLVPWQMIEWMKESGLRWCDLGGYNPEGNPGTAHFKEGFGGRDVRHVGRFEACSSPVSAAIVRGAEFAAGLLRR
jgi:hypothetical protein